MPVTIDTHHTHDLSGLKDKNMGYEYPDGLDLRPGSQKHDKIVRLVMQRARASASVISKRHADWREIDHTLTGYIPLDDAEKRVKERDRRRPVSIVFPYSYAILETLLGYMMSALGDPMLTYEGTGPEDIIGATLLEKVIQHHCLKTKVPLNMHTFYRDCFAYGSGYMSPIWVKRTKAVKHPFGGPAMDSVVFEGNGLVNIDPYCILPDPGVPVHELQKGEFFGWIKRTNMLNLLTEEQQSYGDVFNVKYLKFLGTKTTALISRDPSGRDTKANVGSMEHDRVVTPTDVIYMYAKIIPKDWGLGSGEYPEKWYFAVAGDSVLLEARRLDLVHDLFPVAVGSPEFDGYSVSPLSRLETLFGLQTTLDWLFNSHIKNVRKAINDVLIYDPFLINSEDLKNPDEGRLIRTRRPAWGKGVKDSIMQLPVTDVTQGHIADSAFIVQWMQQIGIADNSAMGAQRQRGPERLTGAEFQGTRQGIISRLGRISTVLSQQTMMDIGEFFAAHTQQFMEQDTHIKITGDWQRRLIAEYGEQAPTRFTVHPSDLDVLYDVVIRDTGTPGGNYTAVWEKMFEVMATHPELAQKFDIGKVFMHIARNNGAKNAEEFLRTDMPQTQTMPTEDVMRQAEAGNMIPVDQAMAEGMV